MSIELGRRVTMRKKVKTSVNNLGTTFTFYHRVIEAYDHFPTKGLRLVRRWVEQMMRTDWRRAPLVEHGFIPNPNGTSRGGRGTGPSDAGRWMRGRDHVDILITERMLMRHGWYRRKLRKQGIWMKDAGKNSVMLTAAGIPPEKMGVRL